MIGAGFLAFAGNRMLIVAEAAGVRWRDVGRVTPSGLRSGPPEFMAGAELIERSRRPQEAVCRQRRSRPQALQPLIKFRDGPLAVSNARVALPNFYNITIRVANVAARLAVLRLRLRDELGSSTSPKFITRLNIRNADIHKAADTIRVGGNAERYRWFVRRRAASGVDKEPGVRDLDVPRRAFAVASAQNATSEDLFVKSSRSFDVGDGEKVCDGKPSCGGI